LAAKPIIQLRSDQYMSCGATMRAPGFSASSTAEAAAMPDANSAASAPPSSLHSKASAGS